MSTRNRNPRNTRFLGTVVAIFTALLLAANLAFAISGIDGPHRRPNGRDSQLRAMFPFAQYATTDWSAVTAALNERPLAAENPRIFSIFLTLGNVFLSGYEIGHVQSVLDRSMGYFEMVAANEDLWGHRPLAGSVVVYLGVSLIRLDSECDVGTSAERIAQLRARVAEIAASEADEIAPIEDLTSLVSASPEEGAARAAIYATAAALLPDDPRSAEWTSNASTIAAALTSAGSASAEASLTMSLVELIYEPSGDVPRALAAFAPSKPLVMAFRHDVSGGGQTAKAAPALDSDALDAVIQDSQANEALLAAYLRQFPPGSQCEIE